LGKKVISFCYPSGKYNDETINLVKAAGYEFAATTKSGYAKLNSPFDLQRERMNSDTNISAYLK
jgi:peptidoglycan/xylan/chitin deacetylase (PgdA/CDA1 family)